MCIATLLAAATAARAVTFTIETPVSGDVVPVTLILEDAPGGDAVDVTVSVPPGEGDLLGVFGNVADEGLVPAMVVDDPAGIVTQWQLQANQVWKVGGGNTMVPVKHWDWGVKLGQTGSAGGAVETASFRLVAPGLSVAQLTGAANQGWVFGVRVQGTTGAEGSSKMGLSEGQPPDPEPPTIAIEAPSDGLLTAQTPIAVTGSVTGIPEPGVDVNGVAAAVTAGSFDASVPLAEGPNLLAATATNVAGTASDAVTVTLDSTPPAVAITDPPDGALTTAASLVVTGTVDDASAMDGLISLLPDSVLDDVREWNPGGADMFPYDDDTGEGDPYLFGLNRDARSTPNDRLVLIAGTNTSGYPLPDLIVAPEPNDSTVTVRSALGFQNDGVTPIDLPKFKLGVAQRETEDFDHKRGGTDEQPISAFASRVITPNLTDWGAGTLEFDVQCNSTTSSGLATATLPFEWNLPRRSVTAVGLVLYVFDGNNEWRIEDGADPETGALGDEDLLRLTDANSIAVADPRPSVTVTAALDPRDFGDPSTHIQAVVVRQVSMGPGLSDGTVPLDPGPPSQVLSPGTPFPRCP